MRSKGSRVTLGVWVLRVYSIDVSQPFATVCNCSQPSATVRNRSRLAVPLASSARVVTFGGFNRCVLVASFRMGGVAFRDIPTCFITCRKCVTGAVLLRRFQKMSCIYRRRTLVTSIVILRGRHSRHST